MKPYKAIFRVRLINIHKGACAMAKGMPMKDGKDKGGKGKGKKC